MSKTLNIMGYDIFVGSLSEINITSSKNMIINTINPHSYIVAKKNLLFQTALKRSDLLLPDGSGVVIASNYIKHRKIEKIAGFDLHTYLLKLLNKESGSCFYMGSSDKTLEKIKKRINKEYPNIRTGFYSPPYKEEFSGHDNEKILAAIKEFNPDVLFLGITAPKQEIWLDMHKDKIDFKIAASIGAVFDFYAGTIKRPSQFWIDCHLEWMPRLFIEPKRLWKRNFISTPLFLFDMILTKFKTKS